MEEERSSYRQILRSTSIVGGATAGAILIGLIRTKIFTLLIGPVGIGLFGVFNQIVITGYLLVGVGIGTSGVRELAAAGEDVAAQSRVRAAIWSLTWPLALTGGLLLWLFREPVARFAAGTAEHGLAVGLLAIAVALNVLNASQFAILQGFRRIGDLSRVRLYGSLLAALIGIGAVYLWPYYGLVIALIAIPVGLISVALAYGGRLPRWSWRSVSLASLGAEWRALVSLGFALMLWTLMGSVVQLAVRAIIVREGGLEAAGLFQAAWMISANYQVLIVAAMLNDYLPRLSAVADKQEAVVQMMDHQLHVALLLAAPLIAGMIAAAPLVLTILYSSEFTAASRLLQWQLLGDFLKISGWALGFILIARKNVLIFLLAEGGLSALYLGLLRWLLPNLGLEAAGIAYFAGYAFYNLIIAAAVWRLHGIAMSRANLRLALLVLAALAVLVIVGGYSQIACFVLGSLVALMFAFHALKEFAGKTEIVPPRLRALAARFTRK